MQLTPDDVLIILWGPLKVNGTLFFTAVNGAILVLLSLFVTRRLATGAKLGRWQNILETLVEGIERHIEEIGLKPPREFVPFLGTLFLFILLSNLLSVVPGYHAPTGSLSTTAALAICVFVATPIWGIRRHGAAGYLRLYLKPTPFMLPFNIIGEISRTLALAVRLFGNVMSGGMIAAILLTVAPLIFPVVMQLLGLITGVIQAYIFSILAAVYIAAAARVEQERDEQQLSEGGTKNG